MLFLFLFVFEALKSKYNGLYKLCIKIYYGDMPFFKEILFFSIWYDVSIDDRSCTVPNIKSSMKYTRRQPQGYFWLTITPWRKKLKVKTFIRISILYGLIAGKIIHKYILLSGYLHTDFNIS